MRGGIWINVGPLLWHFNEGIADENDKAKSKGSFGAQTQLGIGEPGSVELTEEDVIHLIEKMGFKVEHHEKRRRQCGYIQDPESMLQNTYMLSHWVARKAG